jgi:preprotein translocase subunit SecB
MAEEGDVLTNLDGDPAGGNGADTLPVAGVLQQYVKDLSVENPKAPESFQWNEAPQMDVQFNISARKINEEVSEIELKISVHAKAAQGTVYLVELAYCGLVGMRNMPDEHKHAFTYAEAPRILFPFGPPGDRRRGARRGLRAADARPDRLQRHLPAAAAAARRAGHDRGAGGRGLILGLIRHQPERRGVSSLVKNVGTIGGLTAVSRVFGFARDMITARVLGAGLARGCVAAGVHPAEHLPPAVRRGGVLGRVRADVLARAAWGGRRGGGRPVRRRRAVGVRVGAARVLGGRCWRCRGSSGCSRASTRA